MATYSEAVEPKVTVTSSQAYIDSLEEKLRDAECNLDQANKREDGAQSAYDNALAWKNKLEEYWNRIQHTNDLAVKSTVSCNLSNCNPKRSVPIPA